MKRLSAFLRQLARDLAALLRLTWLVCWRHPEDILRYGLRNAVDNQLERDRDQLVDQLVRRFELAAAELPPVPIPPIPTAAPPTSATRHLWPPIPPQLPARLGWVRLPAPPADAARRPGQAVYPPRQRPTLMDVTSGDVP